ncbi:unnamed protein product, partial [Polarella glacialis]
AAQLLSAAEASAAHAEQLDVEEQALQQRHSACAAHTSELRAEASEREQQFREITRDLQAQVASLRVELHSQPISAASHAQ